MTWGFIWLMFVLKIPIIGLFYICWWAVKQQDEPLPEEPAKAPPRPHPHAPPRPRRPRGPHTGDPAVPPSPPRVRPVNAASPQRERHSS